MQKTPFFLIALVLLSISLRAQMVVIGINNNQSLGLASVVRWDANTGIMLDSVITTQPGSVMGSSVYDAVNESYYFDGSIKACRVGFNPDSFSELYNSGMNSNAEVDMANGKIFSVQGTAVYDSTGAYIGSQTEFVRYNIVDSTTTVLGVLPSILGFLLDANCYNSNSGTYYFLGVDTLGTTTLVAIPTRGTGFSPRLMPLTLPNPNLFTLEYDNDHDILYALSDDGTLSWHLQLQQIDTLTGAITLEADFPQLLGYLMTTTSYDQATNSMIMVAIDTLGNTTFYNYSTTANVLSTLLQPYVGEFAELECDNSIYASVKYGSVTAAADVAPTVKLSAYPNPAHDVLRIAGNEIPAAMQITDALGRSTQVSTDGSAIDLSGLAPGCYFLSGRLADGQVVQTRFMKQ